MRTQLVDEPHYCNYYMLCLPQNDPRRNTRHAATPDSLRFRLCANVAAVAPGVPGDRWHTRRYQLAREAMRSRGDVPGGQPRGSHRRWPGWTDVPCRALMSTISCMTVRGSPAGSACVAIVHRLSPGWTTTERRL